MANNDRPLGNKGKNAPHIPGVQPGNKKANAQTKIKTRRGAGRGKRKGG